MIMFAKAAAGARAFFRLGRLHQRDRHVLVQRLWRLAPVQVVGILGVTALGAAAAQSPVPDVYVTSELSGRDSRDPVMDPKSEIRLCTTGRAPCKITYMEIRANGKKVDSFEDAVRPTAGEAAMRTFVISSESTPTVPNRSFEGGTSIALATFRPPKTLAAKELEGDGWEIGFRDALKANRVEVEVQFEYFRATIPFFGVVHLFSGKKVAPLYVADKASA